MNCPNDKMPMELVDSHYDLELEEEEGHPVRIDTYVCPKCHFEYPEEVWE